MSNWTEVDGSKVIGFPWVISPTDKWGIPWGEIIHGDPITIDPNFRPGKSKYASWNLSTGSGRGHTHPGVTVYGFCKLNITDPRS